jgi:hypothetical protein
LEADSELEHRHRPKLFDELGEVQTELHRLLNVDLFPPAEREVTTDFDTTNPTSRLPFSGILFIRIDDIIITGNPDVGNLTP